MAFSKITFDKKIISPAELIPASKNWVCPYDGIYRLSALGAGGSGAAFWLTSYFGSASGGGGGGFCELEVFLLAGTVLTIIIGVGGASKTSSDGSSPVNGANGGDTTIGIIGEGNSGSDVTISMTAGGGKAGTYTSSDVTISGGVGGTASGGDINASGGAGGDALYAYAFAAGNAAGGGAAGSPYGVGGRGGHSKSATAYAASGGGAVGGFKGFDVTATSSFGTGGGTGGTPTTYSTPGPSRLGLLTNYSADGFLRVKTPSMTFGLHKYWGFESLYDPFRSLTGGSCANYAGTAYDGMPGPGAGGKGYIDSTYTMDGNICGGGGGCVLPGGSMSALSGGSLMGGGSGGAVADAGIAISSAGGQGFAVIERIG
jgi:hypothetical protein